MNEEDIEIPEELEIDDKQTTKKRSKKKKLSTFAKKPTASRSSELSIKPDELNIAFVDKKAIKSK